jgi:hypothetical protein
METATSFKKPLKYSLHSSPNPTRFNDAEIGLGQASDQARVTFELLVGQGDLEGQSLEDYEKAFQIFLRVWKSVAGSEALESFIPDDAKAVFDVAVEVMDYFAGFFLTSQVANGFTCVVQSITYDFRDKLLSLCDFISRNRGQSGIEGNADYIWSIPSDIMTQHLHANVMSQDILSSYVP